MKIAVTGANSSVGLNLLGHLRELDDVELDDDELDDVEVVACVRSERAAGEIPESPRVRVRIASYDDRDGLSEALAGATCVVHLAGILLEGRGTSYESANVDTALAVASAAVGAGAEHLVLISVVGADPASTNRYFRTKGLAERAFAESGAPATIVRTPILLGPGTAGAFSLARTVRRGRARLLGGGGYTMRPLDVDDLSEAIVRICRGRPQGVTLHELVGPEPVTYRSLVERAGEMTGTELSLGSMPIWLAKAGAAVRSKLAGGGVTPTVIDVITRDEVVAKNADVELGITLTPLSETLRRILPAQKRVT